MRKPEELLTQFHMDMAASVQKVTEDIVMKLCENLAREFDCENLCLAGGVALNCVANGKVYSNKQFKNIWIQPAAGDAGGSLGAALAAYHLQCKRPRPEVWGVDGMSGSYLGPEFSQHECERRLSEMGASYTVMEDEELFSFAAEALAQEQAMGWFQGRMEFGPRALGNRSILGDPRSPAMQKTLNLKVKFRESFRPFAPSVLRGKVSEWFELECDSPYMLLVAPVRQNLQRQMTQEEQLLFGIDKLNVVRSSIPAVTHIDYSARVQTVHEESNPRYHALLEEFERKTGCPVLINTSFNVRGEPIVCTPEDSFRCFMGTDLDVLVVGNCVLKKSDQKPELLKSYKDQFELD